MEGSNPATRRAKRCQNSGKCTGRSYAAARRCDGLNHGLNGFGHDGPGVDEAWDALEQMHADGKTTDKCSSILLFDRRAGLLSTGSFVEPARYTVSRMLMKTVGDGQAHLDPTRAYRGIALVERFIEMQPEACCTMHHDRAFMPNLFLYICLLEGCR